MMWFLLFAGIFLIFAAVVDALWTTIWTEGVAGPISTRFSRLVWRTWRTLVPSRAKRLHSVAGPFIMAAVIGMWVLMMWLGWTLIFASNISAISNTSDQSYPDFIGRLYFAAMALFTMGNGDMAPTGNGWRIATALANANGFLILTLVISYVMSVLSAEVLKRSFARQVSGLGGHGMDFVASGWNGQNLKDLDLPVQNITSQLSKLTEQHLAYPILHYFQPLESGASSIVAVAVLEDALAALTYAVPEECCPSRATRRSLMAALNDFHQTAQTMPSLKKTGLPPYPSARDLSSEGIECHIGQEEFEDNILRDRADSRKFVNGCLEDAGWNWPTAENPIS